jgi:hypothetical protein
MYGEGPIKPVPHRKSTMIIIRVTRGIFLPRKQEIDWFY